MMQSSFCWKSVRRKFCRENVIFWKARSHCRTFDALPYIGSIEATPCISKTAKTYSKETQGESGRYGAELPPFVNHVHSTSRASPISYQAYTEDKAWTRGDKESFFMMSWNAVRHNNATSRPSGRQSSLIWPLLVLDTPHLSWMHPQHGKENPRWSSQ